MKAEAYKIGRKARMDLGTVVSIGSKRRGRGGAGEEGEGRDGRDGYDGGR